MRGHDGSNDGFIRKIFFEFLGSFNPIPCSFLRNELDIGKGGFFSERVTGSLEDSGGNIDDLILIEDKGFGDSEAPSHLKGSSDHRIRGSRGCGG